MMYADPGLGHQQPFRATYQAEFLEMESRIRKCERERAELERKFGDLMRERAECERSVARALKQRQKRMVEAERQRAERNEGLLRMLHKVDQQAASLAAKTDRLKMLKTQYEMYLMRTWSSPVPMLAAPAPPPPPKSDFVRYLSDMSLQQAASTAVIPPPVALSNYLAAQQVQPVPQTVPTLIDRPYSRSYADMLVPPTPRHTTTVGAVATDKKLEMTNEEFIRYIDAEVLKEMEETPVNPIPELRVEFASSNGTSQVAYLEDVTNEDDYQVGTVKSTVEEVIVEEPVKPVEELATKIPVEEVSESDAIVQRKWQQVVDVHVNDPRKEQAVCGINKESVEGADTVEHHLGELVQDDRKELMEPLGMVDYPPVESSMSSNEIRTDYELADATQYESSGPTQSYEVYQPEASLSATEIQPMAAVQPVEYSEYPVQPTQFDDYQEPPLGDPVDYQPMEPVSYPPVDPTGSYQPSLPTEDPQALQPLPVEQPVDYPIIPDPVGTVEPVYHQEAEQQPQESPSVAYAYDTYNYETAQQPVDVQLAPEAPNPSAHWQTARQAMQSKNLVQTFAQSPSPDGSRVQPAPEQPVYVESPVQPAVEDVQYPVEGQDLQQQAIAADPQAENYQYQATQETPYVGEYADGTVEQPQVYPEYQQGQEAAYQEGYGDPNQQYAYDETTQQYYPQQQEQQQQQPYDAQYYEQVDQQQPQQYVEQGQQELQPEQQQYYAGQEAEELVSQQEQPVQQSATDSGETPVTLTEPESMTSPPKTTPDISSPQPSEPKPEAKKKPEKPSTAGGPKKKLTPKGKTSDDKRTAGQDTPTVSTLNDDSDFDFSTE